jgi:hypothetical protein
MPGPRLAADAGIAVFRAAYERWLAAGDDADMGEIIAEVVRALQLAVVGDAVGRVLVS